MKKVMTILSVLVFLVVGGFMLFREWDMGTRCTAETVGTVERMQKRLERGKERSRAVIGYEAAGHKYSFETSGKSSTLSLGFISFSKSSYQVGDEVTLLYDPEIPSDVMVKGNHEYLGGGIILSAAGILVLILLIRGKVNA